jgi:hypothetical protein
MQHAELVRVVAASAFIFLAGLIVWRRWRRR